MKEVKMFIMGTCPHCKKALEIMEQICEEHPEYKKLAIQITDETKEPDYAAQFDYHYVPTFFVDGVKLHEGKPTKEAIEKVYEAACC